MEVCSGKRFEVSRIDTAASNPEYTCMFGPRLRSLWSRSRLARAASTALVAQVAGAGLNLIAQILFARWAGPSAYGAYSYAMAWTGLLATLAGMGLPQAIVRFIPEYLSTQQYGRLQGVLRRSVHVVALCSGAVGLIGVGLTLVIDARTPLPTLRMPLLLCFGGLPLLALLRLFTEMSIARQHMRVAYVLPRVGRPLAMIGGAALVVWGIQQPFTAPVAVLIALAPVPLIGLVQRWTVHHGLPSAAHNVPPQYATRHWLRTALPMLLITGFLLFLSTTDLLMLGLFERTDVVGLYKVASKMASLVLFPMLALHAVVTPQFASMHAADDTEGMQRLAATSVRWMTLGAVGVAAVLLAGASVWLGLFGPAFRAAEPVLWILVLAQCVNAATGSVGPLLTMTGHQDAAAWVYGSAAVLNVVLNAIGIYALGMMGAALATALSTMLWNIGLYRLVTRRIGVAPSILDALFTR